MLAKTSKVLFVIYLVMAITTIMATLQYPGHGYVYILFSVAFKGLLIMGFRKHKIFFDTFVGVFFWLGFWLKYTFVLLFFRYHFIEATGDFDYSGYASDRGLLICSVGAMGLMIASRVRERYLLSRELYDANGNGDYIAALYGKYRTVVLSAFVVLFIAVAASNLWLGIYQRGLTSCTILPFGLNGVYTWLLLFGLSSFSAVILNCELRYKSNIYLTAIVGLLENFCSSVSMLSRAMIINASALMLGANEVDTHKTVSMDARVKIVAIVVLVALFVSSVFAVNFIRDYRFNLTYSTKDYNANNESVFKGMAAAYRTTYKLFINRWVGIEGVLAVSSYKNLGWDLWTKVWQEKYSDFGTSFYDLEIAKSHYRDVELIRHHFLSMPGLVGFFYYPGSLLFLFAAMFAVGILGAVIEIVVYKICGANLILCSLMAEVVAYRYAHFGYAPRQSYLLFGAMIINILAICVINKICKYIMVKNGGLAVYVK